MKRLVAATFLLLCLFSNAAAHPGGTDSQGGHHVSGTGEYHYHHGHPAHQHDGGICPYNFDNNTGSIAGTSTSFSTKSTTAASISPPSSEDNTPNYAGFLFSAGAGAAVVGFSSSRKRRKSDQENKAQRSALSSQLYTANQEIRRLTLALSRLESDFEKEKKAHNAVKQQFARNQNTLARFRAAEQQARSAEAAKSSATVEVYPFDYTEEQIKHVKKQDSSGVHSQEWWDSILSDQR